MTTNVSYAERLEGRFIEHLRRLERDRSAMAALRRSAEGSPESQAAVHRYVVPFLPAKPDRWRDSWLYSIAAFFALHPSRSTRDESFGATFRRASADKDGAPSEAGERRFVALLAADPDDLAYALRQAISLLKTKDVAVSWERLFRDLLQWRHPDAWVQRQWARAFWAPANSQQTSFPEGDEHVS